MKQSSLEKLMDPSVDAQNRALGESLLTSNCRFDHFDEEQDPDPHQSEKSDLDPQHRMYLTFFSVTFYLKFVEIYKLSL
jgi:hypothetical protein